VTVALHHNDWLIRFLGRWRAIESAILTILNVSFGSIKYIHVAMQTISETFNLTKLRVCLNMVVLSILSRTSDLMGDKSK